MEEFIEKSLILIKPTREDGESQATHLHNCKDRVDKDGGQNV